ncbi:GTP 3',8-cyclase [Fulvitalea axinellae]|uniref:GTP 3',8-cyclase n=1 Tax=Fulvitalea axinellae TaxID=1182444 RepID=A0AAU9CSW3_9BACT|nr:GTP 3',8-cyclase [Fulvitalea axinellae]
MEGKRNILTDSYGREHRYLRISLTDRCNLRCTYCMPEEGIQLTPKSHIMTYDEIYGIAKTFVDHGVTKIRLTGGEPLVRKDARIIMEKLSTLPVELAITTNAVLADRFIDVFKACSIRNINVSLDSLDPVKFGKITRRDFFDKVYSNIRLLAENEFNVKINVVLIKGFNDNEIVDFVNLGKELPVNVRFIEFMPFDGNRWKLDKLVSLEDILLNVSNVFPQQDIVRMEDAKNDTSKNYKIKGYNGSFAVISSVSNPFCGTCNRLRLTANGRMKNCLFSAGETDLLTSYREGKDISPIIENMVWEKAKVRGGMNTLEKLKEPKLHSQNRTMVAIGG